ncbi:GNAT family N-acetyltransferase [Streptomyces sp. NPDC001922]|uniref:GNAT family N-acetyltransferase n=1 Tax=Streptomyces sp. NPDC001922 TaxID=3364624 RepID=UPI00369FCCF6
MIELSPAQAARAVASTGSFVPEPPGPAALAPHIIVRGGVGRWWADRPATPRALAVRSADHCLLRGDPRVLDPLRLAPLDGAYVDAPDRFLPLLGAAFRRLTPWERMVYVLSETSPELSALPRTRSGLTVRQLSPSDSPAITGAGSDLDWIAAPWGGPHRLLAGGHAWGAFDAERRLLALAATYFLGSRYADLGVATLQSHRRLGLARACVAGLCRDLGTRGVTPTWTAGRSNTASRGLAWTSGFRLHRELVHYYVDTPVASAQSGAEQLPDVPHHPRTAERPVERAGEMP